MPRTRTSICLSVNDPPAEIANAGIWVCGIPLLIHLLSELSSTQDWYSGLANSNAAPFFPSAPWHPAQFWWYRTSKRSSSSGRCATESDLGRPGALSQPEIARATMHAATIRIPMDLIACPPLLWKESILVFRDQA